MHRPQASITTNPTTTTVSALRTAVIVAQALADDPPPNVSQAGQAILAAEIATVARFRTQMLRHAMRKIP
jgi:hypothetical protein